MTSTLFQNILPEDIPVMLKRLNAYTKSYQKEEYIKHAGVLRFHRHYRIRLRSHPTGRLLRQPQYHRFYPPGFPVWGGLLPVQEFHIFPWILWQRGLYSDVPKWENTVKHLRQQLHFPSYPDTQSPRNRSAEKYVSESEDQIYLP